MSARPKNRDRAREWADAYTGAPQGLNLGSGARKGLGFIQQTRVPAIREKRRWRFDKLGVWTRAQARPNLDRSISPQVLESLTRYLAPPPGAQGVPPASPDPPQSKSISRCELLWLSFSITSTSLGLTDRCG